MTAKEDKPAVLEDLKEYHTNRNVKFEITFPEGKLPGMSEAGKIEVLIW